MIKKFVVAIAAIAALALASQSAQAGGRHHHHLDKRVTAVAIGAGVASTAVFFSMNDWRWNNWNNGSHFTRLGAWGVTSIGCAAISPIVATAVLQRPLSNREAGVLIGSCVIPIVGGWLVNAAYDAHPEWDSGYQPRQHRHRHHKK